MLAPCEVAVRCALPAIRAMIAKELMLKYRLKQADTARLLGVSQPAISLYCRKIRGKAINLEDDSEVKRLIEKTAQQLSEGNLAYREFISDFCEICRKIRANGLLCEMHKTFDPKLDVEKCQLCTSIKLMKCI
jgi:predicted transcriptional regulator